ncbi:MAG: endonuclease MutS2 [Candidatus Bipolaricaulota bacterium]|nr:endonuclease MutS2 [Candidatus Bipolaricaulota bacterium]MDW8030364.1 endonuclease MutS2 [Candidatus Bipolaricaulota bacterium]
MNVITTAKTLKDLEYTKLKELIKSFACSELGRELIHNLRPSADLQTVQRELDRVEELRIALLEEDLSVEAFEDIRPVLQRAHQTTALHGGEFLAIAKALFQMRRLRERLLKLARFPTLRELGERIQVFRELEENISRVFDDKGEIRPTASPRLRELTTQKRILEERVQRYLHTLIQSGQLAGVLQDTVITRRSGRFVIPIKSSARHELDAVVHDSSDSGQTLYVEPTSIISDNNEIRELEGEIRDEQLRILRELTHKLQAESRRIEETLKAFAYFDMLYAKAQFALHLRCNRPRLTTQGELQLLEARHPLLDQTTVVPIDIRLGAPFQGMVITGPNTGGKTVSLKTIGLLTLMAQSGIPIPAAPDSTVVLFQKVFSDIGDEQSIQQNLSTFSAHMKNLIGILEHADHQTLVLIDELGAGTDPTEGAALGIALLQTLLDRGATLIVTTHFSTIKHFAYQHPKLKTCSVAFDVETLAPTYKIVEGVGSSNAFIIAERLGLSPEVIALAKAHLTEGQVRVEDIIQKLQQERNELAQERLAMSQRAREVEAIKAEYLAKLNELRYRKEQAVSDELRRLEQFVKQARGALEEALHIAKQRASEEQLRARLREVQELRGRLTEAGQQLRHEPAAVPIPIEQLREGLAVQFRGSKKVGIIRKVLSPERIEVDLGGMRLWAKLTDLVQPSEVKRDERQTISVHVDAGSAPAPTLELNVRGMTVSEAIREVDLYLDRLVLAGLTRGYIVHGRGTGVLRREIRKHLATLPIVKSFDSAPPHQGGDGVTIVELVS